MLEPHRSAAAVAAAFAVPGTMRRMSSPATADLCDAHEPKLDDGSLRVLPAVFRDYGKRAAFHGRAVTLRLFEDNTLVRETLSSPGEGRVLVVDGGGSLRRALVGGNIATLAAQNGWAGLIVHGAVRDVAELVLCDVGVRALGTHPRKSRKGGAGARDVPVDIAGVTVRPGDWVYADLDATLVSDTKLHE